MFCGVYLCGSVRWWGSVFQLIGLIFYCFFSFDSIFFITFVQEVLKKYFISIAKSRRLSHDALMRDAGTLYVVNTRCVEIILSEPKKQFISIAKSTQALSRCLDERRLHSLCSKY